MKADDARRIVLRLGVEEDVRRIVEDAPPIPPETVQLVASILRSVRPDA